MYPQGMPLGPSVERHAKLPGWFRGFPSIDNESANALSSTGSILSNTDLSDLSTVGACDILVYQMRHRVM